MKPTPTAEEYFKSQIPKYQAVSEFMTDGDIFYHAKEFAKLHVEAALKEANEKAKWDCETKETYFGDTNRGDYDFMDTGGDGDPYQVHFISVNKDSILNAYPLRKIL